MHEQFEQLVEEKKLHRKMADKVLSLGGKDQASISTFLQKFCLGINYSREFVEYLLDISKRDVVSVSDLLEDRAIVSLAKNVKLPHARKMELLREVLRRKRYPYFYGESQLSNGCATGIGNRSMSNVSSRATATEMTFARQKGSWLKRCPGTLGHICCNYLVINSISGCPFDCTYCYLHTYLNKPGITVFTNFNDLINELQRFFEKNRHAHFRIGTGEFSDSLALDKEQNLAGKLVELFAQQDDHLLELKTKSDKVDHLLNLDHKGKTVFGWSVNPRKIVRSEESGTVSLEKRIKAAKKCVKAGYKVAFHFDPIIFYVGWDKDYEAVVDLIFSEIDPENIAWISLGALRYQPELKDIIEERFPHSRITLGELDVGEDGKMRYFEPIRIGVFRKMHNFIRSHSKKVYLYLCMESNDVWQASGIRNEKDHRFQQYFSFFKKRL